MVLEDLISKYWKLEREIDLLQSNLRIVQSDIEQAKFNMIKPLYVAFANNSTEILLQLFKEFPSVSITDLNLKNGIYLEFNVGFIRKISVSLEYRACGKIQRFHLGFPCYMGDIKEQENIMIAFVERLNTIIDNYIEEAK